MRNNVLWTGCGESGNKKKAKMQKVFLEGIIHWIFSHTIAGIQWNLPGILGDRTKSTKEKQPIGTDPKKIQK